MPSRYGATCTSLTLAPPVVEGVYPRMLGYQLRINLEGKGGVGNLTLKSYEAKVDKCLKKQHFVIQVEVGEEELQAYKHHLPTEEEDVIARGSTASWVPKHSAAINKEGSYENHSFLRNGFSAEAMQEAVEKGFQGKGFQGILEKSVGKIIKQAVQEPIRRLDHKVSSHVSITGLTKVITSKLHIVNGAVIHLLFKI